MKNQIFYLLGAGASVMQNKQTKKACLPLANDFVDKLYKLRYEIKKNDNNIYTTNTGQIINGIALKDVSINELINSFLDILSTADTIDEAMRYFYLNENKRHFIHFKKMISIIFYVFENIEQFRDPRYKQFLMTLLEGKDFKLPNNVKILSWNYDNQFEHACYEIQDKKKKIKKILNEENFLKINGSASFQKVISKIGGDLTPIRENFNKFTKMQNKIDFAWEEEFLSKFNSRVNKVRDFKNEKVKRTLVAIGYSFPYINHKYDFQIINTIMPSKIYIQNPFIENEEALKNSFLERFALKTFQPEIEIIKDCSRFHIPNEMYEGFDSKSLFEIFS